MSDTTVVFIHPSDELYGADRCLLAMVRGRPPETDAVVVLPRDVEYGGALSIALVDAGAIVRTLDFAVLRRSSLRPANWPALVRRLTLGTWRLARLIRDVEAVAVHTNTLAAVSGPVAAVIARRAHTWHIHEMIADEARFVRLAYRFLALLPGQLIANSRASARALAGPLRPIRRKTRVVYPGLLERGAPTRPQTSPTGSPLRVAYVGRLAPRKGITELLEAVALVRERGVNLHLTVYGSAPPGQATREGAYRRLATTIGIADVMTFAGFVADAGQQLGAFDVLVVPSQRPEPFGLVVVEGMAAGCAVVACRNGGGSDEILEHGRTGLYCGRSPASIAAALARLAADPALRRRLGQQAQIAAAERFGIDRFLEGVWQRTP